MIGGERSARATFLQGGIESRIPRRGEIGLTSDQIAEYEYGGDIMSVSRHRRRNAARMERKTKL